MKKKFAINSLVLIILGLSGAWVLAAGGPNDPVPPTLLGLVILFLGAKLGGVLAAKLDQPAVLGELVMGVILGNLALLGSDHLSFISKDEIFSIFAGIGVVLLLFEVGLESSLDELLKIGGVAALVAVIGIAAPFILGYGVSHLMFSYKSEYVHAFVGATLCATSVGITARVLKDLGKINLPESKIILGAAVIDDVLGLIILAIVSGVIASIDAGSGSSISLSSIATISGKAIGFLIVALALGTLCAAPLFRAASKIKLEGTLLTLSLCLCFIFSYLANFMGLAPIVGSFAAGLIVDGKKFAEYFGSDESPLEHMMLPISKFFVPVFFVHMGMQVDLKTFADYKVILFGLTLTLAAIVGKQVCSFGVVGKDNKKLNRFLIGLGMVPRGEVGLIFAAIGSKLAVDGESVISSSLYSAIVMMVMITTMITPPGIKWALKR